MSTRVKITAKRPETKREDSVSKAKRTDFSQSISSPVDHILFLQRTIGNQAVQRLFKSDVIQAKLKIGRPGDIYEQEADRVAEQVMRMPEPQVQRKPEEEDEEEQMQTEIELETLTEEILGERLEKLKQRATMERRDPNWSIRQELYREVDNLYEKKKRIEEKIKKLNIDIIKLGGYPRWQY